MKYIEFEYEIFTAVLMMLALLAGEYLAAFAVVVMYSASQLADELSWQRRMRRMSERADIFARESRGESCLRTK